MVTRFDMKGQVIAERQVQATTTLAEAVAELVVEMKLLRQELSNDKDDQGTSDRHVVYESRRSDNDD